MENTEKKKVGLYLDEKTYQEVKDTYKKEGSRSLTEFMEKAVLHYLGYINSNRMTDYLSPTISQLADGEGSLGLVAVV